MNLLLVLLAGLYLLVATRFWAVWMKHFQREIHALSPSQKRVSLIVLVIATVLWPIAVPIAYLELLNKPRSLNSQDQFTPSLRSPKVSIGSNFDR